MTHFVKSKLSRYVTYGFLSLLNGTFEMSTSCVDSS